MKLPKSYSMMIAEESHVMMSAEKSRAAGWFQALKSEIIAAIEELEKAHSKASSLRAPRFEHCQTRRRSEDGSDAGGGQMALLRGGVFEKVGVNFSEVYGVLGATAQAEMAARNLEGIKSDPRFWASGISLVAHMKNPHAPGVHMNTRMFWTPSGWWFGGGADLNPAIEYGEDSAHFHSVLEAHIAPHGEGLYREMKQWCDRYFYIPHRQRCRGVGGIFLDDRNSGDWAADFALIQAIGRAFLPAFLPLVARRSGQSWSESERAKQLAYRGLYAEYNLLYDRGTKFGLQSGHDPEAVLMSLPPLASWP